MRSRTTAFLNASREGPFPCKIMCRPLRKFAPTSSWRRLTVPSASRECGLSEERRSSSPPVWSTFHTSVTNAASGRNGRLRGHSRPPGLRAVLCLKFDRQIKKNRHLCLTNRAPPVEGRHFPTKRNNHHATSTYQGGGTPRNRSKVPSRGCRTARQE
jgi:hypothetical protein